jgi:hypothetical protein
MRSRGAWGFGKPDHTLSHTKLYDRTSDQISFDEIERIAVW